MHRPLAVLCTAAFVIAASACACAAAESALPPDEAYCRVVAEGRLTIGSQRVRFWGATGGFPEARPCRGHRRRRRRCARAGRQARVAGGTPAV